MFRIDTVARFASAVALLGIARAAAAAPESHEPPEEPSTWETAPEAPEPSAPEARAPTRAPAESAPPLSPPSPPADPVADLDEKRPWQRARAPVGRRVLHGFRLGYLYLMNYERRVPSDDEECPDCSVKERYGLRSPHQFLIGYEIMGRLVGHDWLNVLIVGNVMASGIEQSKFLPSANFLIGFEFDESFQLGVGPNLTLEREKPAHMVIAGGWTPEVGSFYVPVHAFFIPDVDENHRLGMTVGVNW